VAIIGGGIVGCGIARDAALRGLSVILLERADFGSGTTAASTRIVHGGLRYLETADFRLVRMDLRERSTLLRIAPHLVQPQPFVIPLREMTAAGRLRLRAGLGLYDLLAFDGGLPRHRVRNGEAVYFDARVDSPERLAIENVVDAAAHGADVFNHMEVVGAISDGGRIQGVQVRDRLTGEQGEVRSRVTVNAAGPWFERVARLMTPAQSGSIRMTKGVHLVCPPLTDRAMVLFSAVDGRLMFAIPRMGLTWLGTTDTDYSGDPADAVALPEDVTYIVESLKGRFPELDVSRVLFTTAGVRALVRQPGRPSSVSRMHRIVDGAGAGAPGLISVMGGKITGYRQIAEDATDLACVRLNSRVRSTTALRPLPGGRGPRPAHVPAALYDLYGTRAADVMAAAAAAPALQRPLSPRHADIAAQVAFSVRHEFCATVADFIRRRSLLGATADQGWAAASAVADVMTQELGWTAARRQKEIDDYGRDIERTVAFRTSAGVAGRADDADAAGAGAYLR
jgi:glycerol-3-phosphate dehydrogenase